MPIKKTLESAIDDGNLSSFIQHFEPSDLESDEYYNDNLLHEAVIFGSLEIVQFLVENGADVNSVGGTGGGSSIGTTPLTNAASKGKLDVVCWYSGVRSSLRSGRGSQSGKSSPLTGRRHP